MQNNLCLSLIFQFICINTLTMFDWKALDFAYLHIYLHITYIFFFVIASGYLIAWIVNSKDHPFCLIFYFALLHSLWNLFVFVHIEIHNLGIMYVFFSNNIYQVWGCIFMYSDWNSNNKCMSIPICCIRNMLWRRPWRNILNPVV